MKCFCDRKLFLEAYGLAASAKAGRTTNPIGQHILMDADSEFGALLTATNFDVFVRVPVQGVEVIEHGLCILDGEAIGKALENFTEDKFTLETKSDNLTITGGKSKVNLTTQDPALFPQMPKMPESKWTVKSSDLNLLTDRTAEFTDPKSSRYALGGCCLEFGDNTLGMIATDGRRSSEMTVACVGSKSYIKAVVPPSILKLAKKVFGGDVEIAFSGSNTIEPNLIHLRSSFGEIAGRLVEGRFPEIRGRMPKTWKTTIKSLPGPLLGSCKIAAILTSKETQGINLEVIDGNVQTYCSVADRGDAGDCVKVEQEGPGVTVMVAAEYLADALSVVPDDSVLTLRFNDGKDPVGMSLEDGWQHFLFPMTPAPK